MFGLDWFVVVVWSGMSNISFSYENELAWIWFGFEHIYMATCEPTSAASVPAPAREAIAWLLRPEPGTRSRLGIWPPRSWTGLGRPPARGRGGQATFHDPSACWRLPLAFLWGRERS